jgi:hypothetical protein
MRPIHPGKILREDYRKCSGVKSLSLTLSMSRKFPSDPQAFFSEDEEIPYAATLMIVELLIVDWNISIL